MPEASLQQLAHAIAQFAAERDWEKFHSPKNLVMALSCETAELMEHFQWLTQEESRSLSAEKKNQVAMEMADVFIYLLRLAEQLQLDLLTAAQTKLALNAEKYPAAKVRGSAKKYDEYSDE